MQRRGQGWRGRAHPIRTARTLSEPRWRGRGGVLVPWRLPWKSQRKSQRSGSARELRAGTSRASGPLNDGARAADYGFAAAIFRIPIGILARRIRARADAEDCLQAMYRALAIAQQAARRLLTAQRPFVSVKVYEVPLHFGSLAAVGKTQGGRTLCRTPLSHSQRITERMTIL